MDLSLPFFLFSCLLVSSAASDCDRCVHQSKAAYFGTPSTISSGACGYKTQAWLLSGQGYIGVGSPKLFRQGVGCGACYQVRCKNPALCTTGGVKVVLTDSKGNDQTDFVLSPQAFSGMAKRGKAKDLTELGVVDIEYKRKNRVHAAATLDLKGTQSGVPCVYNNPYMAVRVEEQSSNPNYLAVKFLYQGSQTDIVNVQVATVGSNSWVSLKRSYGAVWDTNQVPKGALKLRVVVTSGNWYTANKVVLPANWKSGDVYNTGLQITEVAQEKCYPCDKSVWN